MNRERIKAEPVSVRPVNVSPRGLLNEPGDIFEVEAERLAQRVTGPSPGAPIDVQPAGRHVQRAAEGSATIPALGDSLQLGGGEPLPVSVETHMAERLGHRFDAVRIHRGDYAGRMSRQLNARAFAYDQHLFFGDGTYDPHSAAGQRLIGHELVHTLQQTHRHKLIQRNEKPLTRIVAVHIYLDTGNVVVKTENASYNYTLDKRNGTNIEAGESFKFKRLQKKNRDTAVEPGKYFNVHGPYWKDYPTSPIPYTVTVHSSAQMETDSENEPGEEQEHATGAGEKGEGLGAEGETGTGATVEEEPGKGENAFKDFMDRMGDSDGDTASMSEEDEVKIKTILDQLDSDEVDQFFDTLDEIAASCDTVGQCPSKSYAELLEFYSNLSGPDREALSINQMLKTDPLAASDVLPKQILLNIETEAQQAAEGDQATKTLNQNLALIQSKITDEKVREKFGKIDIDQISELNTLFMIQGLLAGASERLPEIQGVAQELSVNISKLREVILKEIAILAGEMAATALFSAIAAPVSAGGSVVAGAAATGVILMRLNRLKNLIMTIQEMMAAIETIKSVIASVNEIKGKLAVVDFKEFERRIDEVNALYAELKGDDPPENIDVLIDSAEDELLVYAQDHILRHLDGVLDKMYLPEEMMDEELKQLLFDIPAGIEALEEMLAYKGKIEAGNADDSVTLSLKGFQAGYLLAPFVGYLTGSINDALAQITADKDWSELLLGVFSGKKPGRLKTSKKGAAKKRLKDVKTKKQKREADAAAEPQSQKTKKDQHQPVDQQTPPTTGQGDAAWSQLKSQLRQIEQDAINQNGMTKTDIEKVIKPLLKQPSLSSFNPQLDIEVFKKKPGLYRVVVRDRSRDDADSGARRKKQKRKKGFARAKNSDAVGNVVQPEKTRYSAIRKETSEVFKDWPKKNAEDKQKITRKIADLKKDFCYPIQSCYPSAANQESGDIFIEDDVVSGDIIAYRILSRLRSGNPSEVIRIEKSGHYWGSEKNPIKLDWKKWAFNKYDPIYIGPYVAGEFTIDQTELENKKNESLGVRESYADDLLPKLPATATKARKGINEWKNAGAPIEKYKPDEIKPLPRPSLTELGVKPKWQVKTGKILPFVYKTRGHEGGDTFTNKIKLFGYEPEHEKNDGDHIYELQVGGVDRVENMWTLDAEKNRTAGGELKDAVVTRPDGSTIKMKDLKVIARDNVSQGKKMFIKIKSVVSR